MVLRFTPGSELGSLLVLPGRPFRVLRIKQGSAVCKASAMTPLSPVLEFLYSPVMKVPVDVSISS